MTIALQLSVSAIFLGLAVYLGRSWPRRIILTINALAGGVILFLIIKTVSDVFSRSIEFLHSATAVSASLNPWIFMLFSLFGLAGIPLILVFTVRERRRSVILAVAFGLLNLAVSLTISSDAASGLYTIGFLTAVAFGLLFLLEGLSIGALLMRGQPEIMYVLTLGLTAGLPALAGFNLNTVVNLDLIVPFSQAAAAGFLIFYLPFVLTAGKDLNDVKWQFIGMIAGLIVAGAIAAALPVLGA